MARRSGGIGQAARPVTVMLFALVLAALVAFFSLDGEAKGQSTTSPTLTAEEERILQKIIQDTRVADAARARGEIPTASLEEAQAKSRRITTRAMPKAAPRLTPVLMRAGLAGAALGIWVHNVQQWRFYAVDGYKNVSLDAEFTKAPDSRFSVSYFKDGSIAAGVFVTKMTWNVQGNSWTGRIEGYRVVSRWECGYRTCTIPPGFWGGFPQDSSSSYRWDVYGGGPYSPPGPYGAPPLKTDVANDPSLADRAITYTGTGTINRSTNYAFTLDSYRSSVGNADPRYHRPLPTADGSSVVETPRVFDVGGIETLSPDYQPRPGDFVSTPEETWKLIQEIESDPEFDLDEDGLINRDDLEDDGDLVADTQDPKPYDIYSPKPWMGEDFRAPTSSAEREALWGPVIGTWTTPSGGECKKYQYGAHVCDSPGGTTFVWIFEDHTMWMEYPDGSKSWMMHPTNGGSSSGSSSGGASWGGGPENQKPEEDIDELIYPESNPIAVHVVEALNQGDERHRIPGVEPANDVGEVREYIEETVNKVENSGKHFYYEVDAQRQEVLSGPYYSLYTHGEYAGQYKKAYWDNKKEVIIIRDPAARDGGTAFVPDNGEQYRKENFPNNYHNREEP